MKFEIDKKLIMSFTIIIMIFISWKILAFITTPWRFEWDFCGGVGDVSCVKWLYCKIDEIALDAWWICINWEN